MDVELFLLDMLIVVGLAILVLFLGHRFRVPGIVAFIITGILIGPSGLGLIEDETIIRFLAEIGVIFLLFTIGMQFSFRTLSEMRKIVLIGGGLQVGLTVLAVTLLALLLHIPLPSAIFLGLLVCHTSTTVTLRVFQDRGEVNSPHGRTTLGISLFQDVMSVPMILLLPFLAGEGIPAGDFLFTPEMAFAAALVVLLLLARYLLPRLMETITRTRSQELFLLGILFVCVAVTWLTASLGLSLALGAFLAGLILAETPYFHQAFASILPFRDIFTSFFFISVGMLLDARILAASPLLILLLIGGAILLKALLAGASSLALRQSLRTSVLAGIALANIGEFSFVLLLAGQEYAFLDGTVTQVFLTVAVWTMAIAPFLISLGPGISDRVLALPLPRALRAGSDPPAGAEPVALSDHLIVVGYGPNGRNLARAAAIGGIPHIIVDMNPDVVEEEGRKGVPIFFGDASSPSILRLAGIGRARVLAVVTNDPQASRAITSLARKMNPGIYTLVRTSFLRDIDRLRGMGADEVIVDEVETSMELFARVMKKYLVPRQAIDGLISEIRGDACEMLREPSAGRASLGDLGKRLPHVEVESLLVPAGSPLGGRSIGEQRIRTRYRVSILAIERGEAVLVNPDAGTRIEAGDQIILIGTPRDLAAFALVVSGAGGPDAAPPAGPGT